MHPIMRNSPPARQCQHIAAVLKAARWTVFCCLPHQPQSAGRSDARSHPAGRLSGFYHAVIFVRLMVGRRGQGKARHKKKKKKKRRLPACPYGDGGLGREAICLLFFPLLLRLAFVFPSIAIGTQGFVECVCCVQQGQI